MALEHAKSGDVVALRPLGDRIRTLQSYAIVRDDHIEVMRLVLPAGKSLPEHAVAGPVTIQCLEGQAELAVAGTSRRLEAGDLVYLAGGATHTVTALQDASLLVTIVRIPHA